MSDPHSRFSKIVATGIRVSLNTHAPLSLPGTLSTAGHCDQSRTVIVSASSLQNTRRKLPRKASRGAVPIRVWRMGSKARAILRYFPAIGTCESRSGPSKVGLPIPGMFGRRQVRPIPRSWQRTPCFLRFFRCERHSAEVVAAIDREQAIFRCRELVVDYLNECVSRSPPRLRPSSSGSSGE